MNHTPRRTLLLGGLVLASLAHSLNAAITVVADSGAAGPTVLVLTDAVARDITPEIALRQAGAWTLTQGKLLSAPIDEKDSAISSTKPDAVVILRTSRKSAEKASLSARGIADASLFQTLADLKESDGEALVDAKEAELPADIAKAARMSLVIKERGTVPATRVRLFRHTVHGVLADAGMTTSDPWTLIENKPETIEVALYGGRGSESTPGITTFPKIFDADANVKFTMVGPAEITRKDLLNQFDVVFFCGGLSHNQGRALGKDGAEAVRKFLDNGGGYVGTCAGAYLASTGFDWSLGITNAKVIDYKNWLRGTGPVDIELTEEGRKILGDQKGMISIKYANGPLLGPIESAQGVAEGATPFRTLAYFRSDMAKTSPAGVMPNTPAIIGGEFGKGRVLVFSPHPEYTPGLEGFISNALKWVVKKDGTSAE